jgi:endoglucanase
MRANNPLLSIPLIVFLTACGGGGGGSSTPPPSTQSSAPVSFSSISSLSSSIPSSLSSSPSSMSSNSSSFSSASSSSSSVSSSSAGAITATVSTFMVVDQFGYLPMAQKIAVIRDPQIGYDADKSFMPSANLSLVDMTTGETVLNAAPAVWNSGNTDTTSGDKAWWFDFSSVTTPGTYAVVDKAQNVRSLSFKIAADVYKPILKSAFRTFFYQRAGFAKQLPFAEAAWVDGASHIGAGQDKNAHLYNDKGNAATEKDLSGGWYDAGDYNKYTTWGADYVVTLLHAYIENPAAWTDDFNIPESGNGIPDILDEVKWGLDWLKKMQDATGNNSVLSIVGLAGGSPASAATGASYYGTASTNATMATAAAFAFASKVLRDVPALNTYATDLNVRAENAWSWAVANPNVLFFNNDNTRQPGSAGLGAGQQEPIDWNTGTGSVKDRATKKRIAAVYLYASTNGAAYKNHVEADYTDSNLKTWVDNFNEQENSALLYYANLSGVNSGVATNIKNYFKNGMSGGNDNWAAMTSKRDPYLAFLGVYTWGSNNSKSAKGSMFMNIVNYNISGFDNVAAKNYALTYVNYIHGVNPQGKVYLSNMNALGAYNSVNEFYHSWFADGSAKWDSVLTSTYGPAPGFVVGGPNPSYDWDSNCNSNSPNGACGAAAPTPPKGQPAQKSYKDFNTSWPINSWSVTENSNGYQSAYLRLLSKFVN